MRWLACALLLLGGCLSRLPPVNVEEQIGQSHIPYRGLPWYMVDAGGGDPERANERQPVVGREQGGGDLPGEPPVAGRQPVAGREAGGNGPVLARAVPTGARLERLRALMAALDALIVALPAKPTIAQRQALALTLAEIRELQQPYTDLTGSLDELEQLLAQLPSVPPGRVTKLKMRMGDVVDGLRLQLMAAR